MFVTEVSINWASGANTVFNGLRFENLDGGLGILGESKGRPKNNPKHNPLQSSVHLVANCSLAI